MHAGRKRLLFFRRKSNLIFHKTAPTLVQKRVFSQGVTRYTGRRDHIHLEHVTEDQSGSQMKTQAVLLLKPRGFCAESFAPSTSFRLHSIPSVLLSMFAKRSFITAML